MTLLLFRGEVRHSAQDEEGRHRIGQEGLQVVLAGPKNLGNRIRGAVALVDLNDLGRRTEEELHGRGSVKSFLSRSAAKAKVAWMSSASRSGKSARI
jgi:hypothetical protein